MHSDKRKFPRFAFPNDNEIETQLALPDGGGIFKARLLNISLGGLGLAAEKDSLAIIGELEKDSQLQVQSISANSGLKNLEGQKMLVRWVINYDPLKNLGLGCEFVGLSEKGKEAISELLK